MPLGLWAFLIVALLAACQAPPISPDAVTSVAKGDEAFRIGAPVQPGAMEFVRFADVWQREDYGHYDIAGITAEVVLLAADPGKTVALDFRMPTETALSTFNAIAAAEPVWGPAEPVPGWRRQLFYRPFALNPAGRACVGFAGSWDRITEDPEQRPRNALFGYLCQAPGTPISSDEAAAMVRTIRAVPSQFWRTSTAQADRRRQSDLSAIRGMGDRGNASFPFRLARFYVVGNGRGGLR